MNMYFQVLRWWWDFYGFCYLVLNCVCPKQSHVYFIGIFALEKYQKGQNEIFLFYWEYSGFDILERGFSEPLEFKTSNKFATCSERSSIAEYLASIFDFSSVPCANFSSGAWIDRSREFIWACVNPSRPFGPSFYLSMVFDTTLGWLAAFDATICWADIQVYFYLVYALSFVHRSWKGM